MIDIRRIKENPEAVKAGFRAKEVDCDALVDRILELDAASDYRLEFTAPGYSGRFKAVAEGFTEDGTPVYQVFTFEVE